MRHLITSERAASAEAFLHVEACLCRGPRKLRGSLTSEGNNNDIGLSLSYHGHSSQRRIHASQGSTYGSGLSLSMHGSSNLRESLTSHASKASTRLRKSNLCGSLTSLASYSSNQNLTSQGFITENELYQNPPLSSNGRSKFAIVGMSCRFPGGVSCTSAYWELMMKKVNCSSTIPFERWDAPSQAKYLSLNQKETKQVSFGSFVNDIEFFDPTVFNISKSEATAMSPLQRVTIETSFLALLDSGYSKDEMTGQYCGVFLGKWVDSNTGANRESACGTSVYSAIGSSTSIASGRISYVFDFKGPNVVYDTACSSSLVALDAAIAALNDDKCAMALVVGANELFDSTVFDSCAKAGMLSPTGRCHVFDASADG